MKLYWLGIGIGFLAFGLGYPQTLKKRARTGPVAG